MPIAGALICGIAFAAFGAMFHHYVVRISKARAWLARGGILVDVDQRSEFARHHPHVAVNIALEELAQRAHELGGKDRPIVVFAHKWRAGARATSVLRRIGFWEVMNVAGLHTKEDVRAELKRASHERAPFWDGEEERDLDEFAPRQP
jgi:rhodanese-related sulfurtransferase